MNSILDEWESFAETIMPAARSMDSGELRDHAKQILEAIAKDIETTQTAQEQSDKSKDLLPDADVDDSAATIHGELRHLAGFDLRQLGSEYRALRASVLRMWKDQLPQLGDSEFNDMMRFNEAIDEALAASIVRYSAEVDHSRQTFLAILGHDLRSPLSSILMSAAILLKSARLTDEQSGFALRIKRNVSTMSQMINDLLTYASAQIGREIPISREAADMDDICRMSFDEVQSAHPDAALIFESSGDLRGRFDPPRFQQVLSNLLNNAIKHGESGTPVILSASSEAESITVQVRNSGNTIPSGSLEIIFNPLIQLSSDKSGHNPQLTDSIGLGLFIAREIIKGHNGTVDVKSSDEDGTVFTIKLPRN